MRQKYYIIEMDRLDLSMIQLLCLLLLTRHHAIYIDFYVPYHNTILFIPEKANLVKEALFKKTGMKTWPNVFINQHHVGGYDDTIYAYRDGTLRQLLNSKS